jgi:hypothetical protein
VKACWRYDWGWGRWHPMFGSVRFPPPQISPSHSLHQHTFRYYLIDRRLRLISSFCLSTFRAVASINDCEKPFLLSLATTLIHLLHCSQVKPYLLLMQTKQPFPFVDHIYQVTTCLAIPSTSDLMTCIRSLFLFLPYARCCRSRLPYGRIHAFTCHSL